ncbi:MAG: acyltransferase [Burkholderiales bacterium]|nr:acyltransferase [Burkholderiales bacterium]
MNHELKKHQVSSIKYQVSSIKYRPDIDALRAIAVSFVLFFHFNEFILPGGFIGVDVFFVISGFLITQMIYNEAVVGAFSFKLFYARRIKRILPTLYLMLLAVGLVGIWILSPGDNVALSESINANLLYFYNFYLINSGHGYFDNPSNQQFLLHTWSLAVEEQFYFFFPIILIISLKFFKKRNYILYFTAFIFMTSLLISCYTSYKFPSYAYYMLPSRAFELLMGCLLSLYCSLYYQKGIRAKGLQSKTYSGLISVVGLSMILISGFCLDKDTTFPGFWGLLPAFGAVLFIFAGILNKSNLINKTLANKCFVFIGLISYSLYIWHWPILAFFRYENPGKVISLYTGIILFLIILLISIFNYLFVEKRLRKVKLSYQKTISLLLVLPFLIILVISTILHSGIIKKSSRINLENQMPDGYCFNGKAGNCVFGYDPINSKTDIMLFGDSHAAAFSPFFEEIGKQNKFNIFMQSYSGCPPILNFDNSGYSGLIGSCDKSSAVFKVDLTKYKTIVLAGYWSAYVKNPSFINDFKKTLTYLEGQKKNVIIIGDVPNYTYGIIENIKRQRILNDSLGRDLGIESVVLTPINKLDNNLIRNISNKHRNTSFYDFESDLLDIRTYPFYNGYLLYADSNHLNPHGAYILAKTISPHNLLLELHHSLKN